MNSEDEIRALQERNKRVEADKAWEKSLTRRFTIALMTYLVAGCVMLVLNMPKAWLNAFIPAIGYVLSTLSLPFVKQYWLKQRCKKKSTDIQ